MLCFVYWHDFRFAFTEEIVGKWIKLSFEEENNFLLLTVEMEDCLIWSVWIFIIIIQAWIIFHQVKNWSQTVSSFSALFECPTLLSDEVWWTWKDDSEGFLRKATLNCSSVTLTRNAFNATCWCKMYKSDTVGTVGRQWKLNEDNLLIFVEMHPKLWKVRF